MRGIFSELVKKHSLITVLIFSIVFLIALLQLRKLRYETTLTGYLPATSDYVKAYFQIEEDFGGGEIGLIGFEGDDVLSEGSLRTLKRVYERIKTVRGVYSVFSIFDALEFISKPEGLEIRPLIGDFSLSYTEKVKIRDHPDYSGLLISKDGRASCMVVRIKEKELIRAVEEIRRVVDETKGTLRVFYSGSPFISYFIINAVKRDIQKISPFVAFFTLLILSYFFRNLSAVFISTLTVGASVVITYGLMALLNEPISIVNSSIPALLFAVSSAYAVHTFRGFSQTGEIDEYLKTVGIPIFFAAITTAGGFFFLFIMEMHAIRMFGVLVATGVIISAFIAVILIPCLFVLFRKYPRGWEIQNPVIEKIVEGTGFLSKRMMVRALLPFFLILIFIRFLPSIHYRTEEEAFFKEGSEPIKGMEFFSRKFGGSDYLMIRVKGDFSSPSTLLFVDTLSTFLKGLKGVTRVDSFSSIIKRAQSSMTGIQFFPLKEEEIDTITFFIEGEKEVKGVYNREKGSALILARGDADLWEEEYGRLKDMVGSLLSAYRKGKKELFIKRVEVFNSLHGYTLNPQELYSTLDKKGDFGADISLVESAMKLNPDVFAPLPPESMMRELFYSIKRGRLTFDRICAFYRADEDLCNVMEFMFKDSLEKVMKMKRIREAGRFFYPDISEEEILYLLSPFYIEGGTPDIEVSITSSALIMKEIEREMRKGQIISTILSAFFSTILLFLLSGELLTLLNGIISSLFPFLTLWSFYSIAGINVDMGSLLVPSVSIGLCIDYSLHSVWGKREGVDMKKLAIAIIMNALSVGGGFAGMVLSSVRPTLKFGLGTSFTVLLGAFLAIIYLGEEGGEEKAQEVRR